MADDEFEVLRANFPDLEWTADPQPHRYRAYNLARETWMLVKFSSDSAAWALAPITAEAMGDGPHIEEFAERQLDRQLERVMASVADG